jgi:hypothetical protein
MPKASRRSRTAIVSEALATLAGLAVKGAYALLPQSCEPGRDRCPLYSPRTCPATPVAHASRAAISLALQSGWLEADAPGDRMRLTPAGLRALRMARSKATAPAAGRKPRGGAGAASSAPAPQIEGPLAWLRRRKNRFGMPFMTEAQISAAERLAGDFWLGGMAPRVTADWSAPAPRERSRRATPGLGVEMSDSALAARQRFFAALSAVGSELGRILVDVCCDDRGLEAIEQAAGWPQRTARVVLDLALKELARHYGLLPTELPAVGRLRHWGDAGYRPTLAAWR